MKNINIYWLISNLLAISWIALFAFQMLQPNVIRGILMWFIFILCVVFTLIDKVKNKKKSIFYDENRKKHIRNHIVYIGAIMGTVFIIGFIYLQI
ncbi:MAG: hypothetical protein FWG98_09135 [Candidatus Cloacimonetes bacterium]|nr:hypothetical protein [Candidatus Cloacimonadota bacterium]